MLNETAKIVIAIILGIVLGFALGFVLFKHNKINGGKIFNGGDTLTDDINYVETNKTFNDETKNEFLKIIDKYHYETDTTDRLYWKILYNNIYNKDINHKLYKCIIEKNKYNKDTHILYAIMIKNLQLYSKDYKNNINNLCELMTDNNPYRSVKYQQQSTHNLYRMIFTIIIYYYGQSNDFYEKIINNHPYNNDNEPLYDLILECNPKDTYYEFDMNDNTMTDIDPFIGTDDEVKEFEVDERSNGYIYITPKHRKLNLLYELILDSRIPTPSDVRPNRFG